MGNSALKLSLLALAAFVTQFAVASSASALGVICENECSALGAVEVGDGEYTDFVFGGVETTDGRAIKIRTKGHVYVVGPIGSSKSSRLKGSTIIMDGESSSTSGTRFVTKNLITDYTSPGSYQRATEGGSEGRRSRGGFSVRETSSAVKIKSSGDIYIDVSGVDPNLLKIKARGTIMVSDESLTGGEPVPEPTVALLMGLGLAGLSLRRNRTTA